MIVVGYQGIGKSSLAGKDGRFIDLESSCFYINGMRDNQWYIPYCEIAISLSKQGFIVFTSSHEQVRSVFRSCFEHVVVCYPSESLRVGWIDRLEQRYTQTHSVKDYRALENAKLHFCENIIDLKKEKDFGHIVLQSMYYNLEDEINKYLIEL